jgi:glycosyltransferase involved in cell wall biosynthesis
VGRALRICFVAYRGNMRCGGQGVYLWFLARELARLGHAVDVLVGPPYPDPMPFARVWRLPNALFWERWFQGGGARVLPRERPLGALAPLTFYELAASWLGFLPEPFAFSLRAFRTLARRLARGTRYDLVHDVQCLGWGVLGIRALGPPVVTTIHHPLTVDRRASFARDRTLAEAIGTMQFYPVGMQGFVARRIDRVLTSSASSARDLERDFRVPPERLRMVANGVDTELFCPDPAAVRDAHEILCVGRASDPNKGVLTLVEALALLPEPVRLALVDDDGPENPARRRAAELGCSERLRIAGRVSTAELLALYRRAALVVVPSRHEGFGLPAVEAMACGTPVVAAAAGALPEVVRSAGGGILVEPESAQALAKGIAQLLEQPAARAELGVRGRRGVEAAYAWPRVAEATAAVYAEVLAERRGGPARITTSASAGSRRASASSARSAARAAGSGSVFRARLQPGKPQSKETPSTSSRSIAAPACSRRSASS